MGTPTKRITAANPPKMKANMVSHSEAVGGLGVAVAGGRSILMLIVESGAQKKKIINKTTSANKLNLNQPDFVIRRPNNLQSSSRKIKTVPPYVRSQGIGGELLAIAMLSLFAC